MEPNNITLREKLGNAIANISQMMRSDKRVLFSVIGVGMLVVIFLLVMIVSFSQSQKNEIVTDAGPVVSKTASKKVATVIKPKIPATLTLVLADDKKIYHVNDPISFTLVGDSAGVPVRGYDIVFKFDPNLVTFTLEKNLFPAFGYIRRIRGNWVIVTGQQPLQKTQAITLFKTKLMGFTFTAKKAGTAFFPVSFIPDSYSDSNLIDTGSNDILSKASGIFVQISK